ncbi:hypothetical protein MCY_01304, partial [Bartonella rattimassiliensis 15908]
FTKEINNAIADVQGDSLVKKEIDTNQITIGKAVEGGEINIANSHGEARTLSGVKEATKSDEAVNKGQLDENLEKLSTSLQSVDSAVVHYDKNARGEINYASVTLGGKEKPLVGLHNVANGVISSESHDAINGSQLYALGSGVAKSLGGGA